MTIFVNGINRNLCSELTIREDFELMVEGIKIDEVKESYDNGGNAPFFGCREIIQVLNEARIIDYACKIVGTKDNIDIDKMSNDLEIEKEFIISTLDKAGLSMFILKR